MDNKMTEREAFEKFKLDFIEIHGDTPSLFDTWKASKKAATIAERERCASVCDGLPHSDNYTCAEEIRVGE
jgi:hypothetical protein